MNFIPGESCVAQIRLDEPVSLIRDDRFVIRSYSPGAHHRRRQGDQPHPGQAQTLPAGVVDGLAALAECRPEASSTIRPAWPGPARRQFRDLLLMTNLPAKALEATIAAMLNSQTIMLVDKENRTYIHLAVFTS
jgi:selenocysteine-specific elongation factor